MLLLPESEADVGNGARVGHEEVLGPRSTWRSLPQGERTIRRRKARRLSVLGSGEPPKQRGIQRQLWLLTAPEAQLAGAMEPGLLKGAC